MPRTWSYHLVNWDGAVDLCLCSESVEFLLPLSGCLLVEFQRHRRSTFKTYGTPCSYLEAAIKDYTSGRRICRRG